MGSHGWCVPPMRSPDYISLRKQRDSGGVELLYDKENTDKGHLFNDVHDYNDRSEWLYEF